MCIWAKWPIRVELTPIAVAWSNIELGLMLGVTHCRVTPSIKFTSNNLYTWVERGTVRIKCLAQEHNTMSPAGTWTWTTWSGVKASNHDATSPPVFSIYIHVHCRNVFQFFKWSYCMTTIYVFLLIIPSMKACCLNKRVLFSLFSLQRSCKKSGWQVPELYWWRA